MAKLDNEIRDFNIAPPLKLPVKTRELTCEEMVELLNDAERRIENTTNILIEVLRLYYPGRLTDMGMNESKPTKSEQLSKEQIEELLNGLGAAPSAVVEYGKRTP